MKRVILESPYAGDVALNLAYARACLRDSLTRGEAPIASHLLYPTVLDDSVPEERKLGIEAGLAWLPVAELMAIYVDNGWSAGMRAALSAAVAVGIPYELRKVA